MTLAFESKATAAAVEAEKKLLLAESQAKNAAIGQSVVHDFRNDVASARLKDELVTAKGELAAKDEAVEKSLAIYREEAGVGILKALKTN